MQPGEKESARVSTALKEAVRRAGFSLQAVDQKAGWSVGYLSQLLRGNVDLKVWQLFTVLGVIGKPPAEFFAEIYDLVGKSSEIDDLEREYHEGSRKGLVEFVDGRVMKILRDLDRKKSH